MLYADVQRPRLLSVAGRVLPLVAVLMLGTPDAEATHSCVPQPADDDGDGLPYTCDPNDGSADMDADGFEDSLEVYVSTDPASRCSFPPDINNDGGVDIGDVLKLRPAMLSHADDPNHRARLDLNADEQVNIGDVISGFSGFILTRCPYPTHPSSVVKTLHAETADGTLASHWFTNHAEVFIPDPAWSYPIFCQQFGEAGAHWTNATDFDFSVSYTGGGDCNGTGNVEFSWQPLGSAAGAVALWTLDHQCTTGNPCTYAYYARLFLNQNDPSVGNNVSFRHMVITHELGHVTAAKDINRCDSPACSIMFGVADCLWNAGLHWPRANDIIFTNIKY